jgi:hypothetical protein
MATCDCGNHLATGLPAVPRLAAQKAPCRGSRKWLNPNAGEIALAVASRVYLLTQTNTRTLVASAQPLNA